MNLTTRQLMQVAKFRNDQKLLGLSNSKMAEALGFSVSHLENMRGGRKLIKPHTQKLMDALLKRENLHSYEFKNLDNEAIDPNTEV